jgi:hypothetical protein
MRWWTQIMLPWLPSRGEMRPVRAAFHSRLTAFFYAHLVVTAVIRLDAPKPCRLNNVQLSSLVFAT